MSKFQRTYSLVIDSNVDSSQITINPPFTISFNINKGQTSSMNTMSLQIYNLNPETRNNIFQDFLGDEAHTKLKTLTLQAGYGTELNTIFKGNMRKADSYRSGMDIITDIEAYDGQISVSKSTTNTTVSNIPLTDLLTMLIGDLQDCDGIGKIGDIQGDIKKPVTLYGNTWELIKKYFGDNCFFDLNKINLLKDNECVEGDIRLLTSDSGLIGTPRRMDAQVEVEMVFEPKITLGQFIEIHSDIQPQYNGQYKVVGIVHNGTISESVGGDCTTKLMLLIGTSQVGGLTLIS